ncbi:MAG TPA: hypothetical protein VGM86_22915 [Thermoanaerobaculia bacterium]
MTASLPSAEELRELAAREGIDAATERLYRLVLESPVHGPFIRRVDELRNEPTLPGWDRDAVLAVVPGLSYRENPRSGADGLHVREEAGRMGCPTCLVPLASGGTVRENARLLCDWLIGQPGRPVILVSLSKGGADVKTALAEPDADHAFRNVVAWVSLCGILDGTRMADWLLSRNPRAAMLRLYCRLRGQSTAVLHDLCYRCGSPLDRPLRLPPRIRLISVVGFPLRRHFTRGAARRCHGRLADLGPNDGTLVLADVCALPGLVYPVWGADHYLQPKGGTGVLVRGILGYLGEALGE